MTTQFDDLNEIGESAKRALRAAVERISDPEFPAPDFNASLMELHSRVARDEVSVNRNARKVEYSSRNFRGWMGSSKTGSPWWNLAWSLSLVMVLAIAGIQYIPSIIGTTQSQSQTRTYTTLRGQRATITLADGSRVILAPETRLTYVSGNNTRTVTLTGQAQFEIVASSSNPFIVRAGNSITRVLGTTFSVRAYQDDRNVRVAVSEGKVAIGNTVIAAQQAAVVDASGLASVYAASASDFAWAAGRLVFERETARHIVRVLEREYDIAITGWDAFTGRYTLTLVGESADAALHVLAFALDANVQRQGNLATLTPRKSRGSSKPVQ